MYLDFYGLREAPFNLTPDPEYFFMSAGHRRALSYLTYGISQRKGFMQLTGEVGSGKTMIVRRLLSELQDQAITAYVLNPADTFGGLLRFILKDLGVRVEHAADLSKTELLDVLYQFLLEQEQAGVPVLVIFDEAQNLSYDVLEEVRMISNFETTKEKLIQIIFVGQPEFKEIAASPRLRQLAQRISIRHHLGPLNQDEVAAYLDHRLRVAGGDRIHFTAMAKDIIWDYSKGIPRLINVVGDYGLLVGYVNETFVLNHRILNEAIAELEGRAAPLEDNNGAGFRSPWPDAPRGRNRRRRGRRMRRRKHADALTGSPDDDEAFDAADDVDDFDAEAETATGDDSQGDAADEAVASYEEDETSAVPSSEQADAGTPAEEAVVAARVAAEADEEEAWNARLAAEQRAAAPSPAGAVAREGGGARISASPAPARMPPVGPRPPEFNRAALHPRQRRQQWHRRVVVEDPESLAARALERGRAFGLAPMDEAAEPPAETPPDSPRAPASPVPSGVSLKAPAAPALQDVALAGAGADQLDTPSPPRSWWRRVAAAVLGWLF